MTNNGAPPVRMTPILSPEKCPGVTDGPGNQTRIVRE